MSAAPTIVIDGPTEARSALYDALADALAFPSREFHALVCSREFLTQIEGLVAALPYELSDGDLGGLGDAGDYVDFQAEYIRLFDVGAVRPPCPLYGGEWGGSRKQSMEEALRFYRFFGLKLDEGARELPDHVTVELEFMQVLARAEGMARARNGDDPAPFLRAERDFLTRHLGRWWPLVRRKLASQRPSPFYDALTSLTARSLAGDLAYVRSLLAG